MSLLGAKGVQVPWSLIHLLAHFLFVLEQSAEPLSYLVFFASDEKNQVPALVNGSLQQRDVLPAEGLGENSLSSDCIQRTCVSRKD